MMIETQKLIDKINSYFDWEDNYEKLIEFQNAFAREAQHKEYKETYDCGGTIICRTFSEIVNEDILEYKISKQMRLDLGIYNIDKLLYKSVEDAFCNHFNQFMEDTIECACEC